MNTSSSALLDKAQDVVYGAIFFCTSAILALIITLLCEEALIRASMDPIPFFCGVLCIVAAGVSSYAYDVFS